MFYIQRLLSAPMRLLMTPLRWISTQLRGVTGGARRITSLPSRLGIRPSKLPLESMRLWFDSLTPQRITKRKRISERAQFSQIHLIQPSNNKRTVLHIGTAIGRRHAQFALKHADGATLTLEFTLADPHEMDAPVRLTFQPRDMRVLVNDIPVIGETYLRSHDTITVGGKRFLYELYAWDKAPIVTRVDAGWATTNGAVRERNEDAIGIYQHARGYLFAIADGVGNGQDGDMISAFSVQYLLAVFAKNIPFDLPWHEVLGTGFQYINSEVRHFAQTALLPTGSTLTAMVIKNWEAHVAHVGDSRLYRMRNGVLDQLTADHVKRLPVEMPTRVAMEGTSIPPLHDILTRAIGKTDTIQPDFLTVGLQPRDRFLLITDGISKRLSLSDIAEATASGRPAQAAAHLVELANELATDDNASVIVIDIVSEAFTDDTWKAVSKDRVFVGNRGWSLRLRRREDPNTVVPLTSGGCLFIIAVLIIVVIVWVILRAGAGITSG